MFFGSFVDRNVLFRHDHMRWLPLQNKKRGNLTIRKSNIFWGMYIIQKMLLISNQMCKNWGC